MDLSYIKQHYLGLYCQCNNGLGLSVTLLSAQYPHSLSVTLLSARPAVIGKIS